MRFPASESNMNSDGALFPLALTTKSLGLLAARKLNTVPVGPGESLTVRATLLIFCLPLAPWYSVAVLVLLFVTHSGVVGPSEIPHGFETSGSVSLAIPGTSETRLVWANALRPPLAPPAADAGTASAAATAAATAAAHHLPRMIRELPCFALIAMPFRLARACLALFPLSRVPASRLMPPPPPKARAPAR